jgi:3-phosphoshikimate 1-carboxyvinyltransferase
MSIVKISHPTNEVSGQVELPASKSVSNRLLMIEALSGKKDFITNLSEADDTKIMQDALQLKSHIIDVKNAGTCMRFLAAYFAALPGTDIVLHGNERMHQRPIKSLVDALRYLGADIDYIHHLGYPPLRIRGRKLKGGNIRVDTSISSQTVSALMLIAPYIQGGIILQMENNPVSVSYIHLTASLMRQMGAVIKTNKDTIIIDEVSYIPQPISVERDWSAAAFFYTHAALAKHAMLELMYLPPFSAQGDKEIANYMTRFGVTTTQYEDSMLLTQNHERFLMSYYELADMPDLVQPFGVAIGFLGLRTLFTRIAHLRHKETDRLDAMVNELTKCGVLAEIMEEQLHIFGFEEQVKHTPIIDTYGDHRMAMAFAPAALIYPEVHIKNPEVVNKSFPGYWQQLQNIGYQLEFV